MRFFYWRVCIETLCCYSHTATRAAIDFFKKTILLIFGKYSKTIVLGTVTQNDSDERRAAALEQLAAAISAAALQILRLSAPNFAAPKFYNPDVPPADYQWPKTYLEAIPVTINPEVLAAVGALMREWAAAEVCFDRAMRQMAKYPPVVSDPIAASLDLYTFKAKATAWGKIQNIIFVGNKDALGFSKHILSRAKSLSSIRNEIAHWTGLPGGDSLVLFDIPNSNLENIRSSIWSTVQIEDVARDIVHLRTALISFTQYCFTLWLPSGVDVPNEFTSQSGINILRSYIIQRPASRPPRKKGWPNSTALQ